MPVSFNCPKCGQKLTLTASRPGDWLDCPACEAAIQVPGDAPARPAKPQAAEPESRTDKKLLVGVVAGVVGLLLIGGGVVALALQKPKPNSEQAHANPPAQPAPPVVPPPVVPPKPKDNPPEPPPEIPKPEIVNLELTQTKQRTLRLGVNGPNYDDVGAILNSLGKGYAYTKLTDLDLENADRLKEFDVVFVNCGGPVGRPELTSKALREFVGSGKSLYASDLQYDLIAMAFPEATDKKKLYRGPVGTFEAEVLDPGLRDLLGNKVDLAFNANNWQAAAFGGQGVTTILQAAEGGRLKKGTPLLVKFGHGQTTGQGQGRGTVFFTSFHNSAIASDTAKKLLRYLVFSAVIADAEGRVLKVLKREDFTVKPPDLLTAPDTDWSATRTHTQAKPGVFRVGVGFNNEGAEVKLVVEGPGGVRLEKEGKDAFIAEVRYATPGEWKLTVTPTKLPYPNFPISLIVAAPK